MNKPFFGEWFFSEGDFFTMPSVTISVERIIKGQGYANEGCCLWNVSAEERSEEDYLEELAERISREVSIKRALKKAKKTKKDKKEKKTKKVVQDAVVAGNDADFFSMITDLLCTDEGLIKVPAGQNTP
jgi:hypothetical protein